MMVHVKVKIGGADRDAYLLDFVHIAETGTFAIISLKTDSDGTLQRVPLEQVRLSPGVPGAAYINRELLKKET